MVDISKRPTQPPEDPKEIVKSMSIEEWFSGLASEPGDEDTYALHMRLPKGIVLILDRLRDDPDSPYYKAWRNRSDEMRQFVLYGLLKLSQGWGEYKSEATGYYLKQRELEIAAARESRQVTAQGIMALFTDNLIKALIIGDTAWALKSTDEMLNKLDKLPFKDALPYKEALFKNPRFPFITDRLLTQSGPLQDLIKELT